MQFSPPSHHLSGNTILCCDWGNWLHPVVDTVQGLGALWQLSILCHCHHSEHSPLCPVGSLVAHIWRRPVHADWSSGQVLSGRAPNPVVAVDTAAADVSGAQWGDSHPESPKPGETIKEASATRSV
jgi:hypothetical protein